MSWRDSVRVSGVLVFDHGHGDDPEDNPQKLEIHPVYSVDKISATFGDLSGAWTDDVGNTYYLRHDPSDDAVWYVGLSPLGNSAFAQVFRGTFYPAPVSKEPAVSEGVGGPSVKPPQNALVGDVVAIDLGWGTAPPLQESGTLLGNTGPVTFQLGSAMIPAVPALSVGNFRLIKLYDA
jgi:hypothetical protein